jgi:hypothetical protein
MVKSKKQLVEAIMNHTNLNKNDVTTTSGSAGFKKTGMKKLLETLRDSEGPEKGYKEHIKEKYNPNNY